MLNEEGKRLGMFIERVCKLSQRAFAEEVTTPEKPIRASDINKYIQGNAIIPSYLLKVMHRKWRLNYEWIFDGTGALQVDKLDQRKISHDLTDILASVSVIERMVIQLKRDQNQLARDFYSHKAGV
jgi:hypothetical protein